MAEASSFTAFFRFSLFLLLFFFLLSIFQTEQQNKSTEAKRIVGRKIEHTREGLLESFSLFLFFFFQNFTFLESAEVPRQSSSRLFSHFFSNRKKP